MENLRAWIKSFRFKGVAAITLVFALITVILLVQIAGVKFNGMHVGGFALMPADRIVTKTEAYAQLEKDTLLVYSSLDESSMVAYEQFCVILQDMKMGCVEADIAATEMPNPAGFSVVIVLFNDLTPLGQRLIELCDYVYNGGNVYFPLTLIKNAHFYAMENRLGIVTCEGNSRVNCIYIRDGFMIGGGRSFDIEDGYDSAATVELDPERTTVYANIDHEQGVPLIWSARYGEGLFVVNNFGLCDKSVRGFFAASLSLCGEVFLYPVINGATFYLDDFPSQIPEGDNTYIKRDYGTSVRGFYVNNWWPDMMNLSDEFGIKYTGLAILCYDDAVDGTTDATPDTATFINFGNMLLRKGGELGYHGYNHQPLCLDNVDYKGFYDYKTWESREAMKKGIDRMVDFCEGIFPDVPMGIYVPPSNVLSAEGRQLLTEDYPQIHTLSGIYLPEDARGFSLVQEFEVDQKGVVDQPRIISGCDLDSYMKTAAFSELNLHFVNNHFTHPDDALDPERGAELGWKELRNRFEGYLEWLYGSAPGLRNFTGTEFSAAVQRYAALVPQTELGAEELRLTIGNYYDDAQFLVRFNGKEPRGVEGGSLTHMTGDLYLLQATQAEVRISFQ